MLSGEGKENGQNKSVGLISKKKTLHVQQTFLYISVSLFCTTTTRNSARNFPVTRFMEEMLYVFLFTFFRCHSFSP